MQSPAPSGSAPRPPSLPRRALRRARRALAERVRAALRALAALATWPWRHRPPPPRAVAHLFAAALVAAGVAGAAFPLALRARLPSPLDWAGVGALLARDARPGDVAVISPPWAERLRLVAPAGMPVLALPRYAGEALPGVRRIWLVSLTDAPGFSWDPELDLLVRAARSDPPLPLGDLQVTRYDLAFPDLPLAVLHDRLARAQVAAGLEPCTPDRAGGFRCGASGGGVTRSVRDVEGVARPCLVVKGAAAPGLAITFPDLPLGRTLLGHAGLPGHPAPDRAAGRTRISVTVDDEDAGQAELPAGGWRTFRIDTSRFAGAPHRLVLHLSGPAELCLDAVTLP